MNFVNESLITKVCSMYPTPDVSNVMFIQTFCLTRRERVPCTAGHQ
jgi:hypothetical protein